MGYNEWLMVGVTAFCLLVCLVCFKLGRRWVEGFMVTSLVSLYVLNVKFIDVFGEIALIGMPVYAGLFLATDMLSERYGKETALRMVRIGFMSVLFFTGLTQLALLFPGVPGYESGALALKQIADLGARMIIGSMLAYIIAQHWDVYCYDWLRSKTGDRLLWLRNNLSTASSQLIDTVIFVTIAFYGVVDDLTSLVLVTFIGKLIVALVDTPFMYLSKKITPLDMADAAKLGRVYQQDSKQ